MNHFLYLTFTNDDSVYYKNNYLRMVLSGMPTRANTSRVCSHIKFRAAGVCKVVVETPPCPSLLIRRSEFKSKPKEERSAV